MTWRARSSGDTPDTSTSAAVSCVAGDMRACPTSGLWPLARYLIIAYTTLPGGACRLNAASLFLGARSRAVGVG